MAQSDGDKLRKQLMALTKTTEQRLSDSPFGRYAQATGWVCMRLSYADLMIGDLLIVLMGTKTLELNQAIAGPLDLNHKIKLLTAVAAVKSHDENWLQRLKTVLNKVRAHSENRHRYAHDVWVITPSQEMVRLWFKMREPQKGDPSAKLETIQEVKMLVDEMYKVAESIDLASARISALKQEYVDFHRRRRKRKPPT